ncbi:MAG: TetR family transcriptional regulator [Planctomycetota bacterium]
MRSAKSEAEGAPADRPRTRRNGDETRRRILEAAQLLFAKHGVAATSLRAVAREAGVHQPSLHYHFRDKDQLFAEMLELRVVPLYRARLAALDALEAEGGGDGHNLERILSAAQRPIIDAWSDPIAPGVSIVHLIYRGIIDGDPEWGPFGEEFALPVRERFVTAFARALPHLSRAELLERLSFMQGALAGLYLDRSEDEMTRSWLELHADLDAFEARMIALCCAVLRAPSTHSPVSDSSPSRDR